MKCIIHPKAFQSIVEKAANTTAATKNGEVVQNQTIPSNCLQQGGASVVNDLSEIPGLKQTFG